MSRNIDGRLGQLKSRRSGTDRLDRLSTNEQIEVLGKSLSPERYSSRSPGNKYTQYALGAMEAVDATYTRISIEEAERVGNQLDRGLAAAGRRVEFRLQGSVPCDIHIRGVSDVDLLVLDTSFVTAETPEVRAYTTVSFTPVSALQSLRDNSISVLGSAFPAVKVDTSGSKAIALSGGSLRRPVDVVPSHWHDTLPYQRTSSEVVRGVKILNASVPETVLNMPFLHIARINQRDSESLGGIKKAIRLCKNVKADAIAEGTDISLSSFDIASVVWHADITNLISAPGYELTILAEVSQHLADLVANPIKAGLLDVPDGSRKIFDANGKFEGLKKLSAEIDDLALEVSREQSRGFRNLTPTRVDIGNTLRGAAVPG